MNHIDAMRKALEYMRDNEDSTPYWSHLADASWSALQAHEAEVKELVSALRKLERFVTNSDDDFGLEQDWTEECRKVVMGARAVLAKVQP